MTTTLKHFLQELSFIEISEIKRHAKGLLKALENSNRKEMLDYEITPKDKNAPCKNPIHNFPEGGDMCPDCKTFWS